MKPSKIKCLRCEEYFEPVYRGDDTFTLRCEICNQFVAAQAHQACKTGKVTTRSGLTIPVWMSYRCLYCNEYFNLTEAEIHFGKTREQDRSEMRRSAKMDPDMPGHHDPDTCRCRECCNSRGGG